MQKNLIIAVLSLIVLMMLWPSKKPSINKDENSLSYNEPLASVNTNQDSRNSPRYSAPGSNYVCPAPQSYNPQYPVPNPWYVTPQMQPNQMGGQPVYPQQSQMPNTWGYPQQQYYLPNYRFRNPNNNELPNNNPEFNNNTDNMTQPSYPSSPSSTGWNYTPYQQQPPAPTTFEQNPPRYTPPQFQEHYPGY